MKALKIRILEKDDTQDLEQVEVLLKKFVIDTYIRNKPEYSNLKGAKKFEAVNQAISEVDGNSELSILTKEDLNEIRGEIQNQINSLRNSINNKNNRGIETRYYVLKDGNEIVAFQQAQVAKRDGDDRIEGWRNLAYIEQAYAGQTGIVIDNTGANIEGLYSDVLYDSIGNWFNESDVNYERTCTGVNMLSNILAYVKIKGFLPCGKNDHTIFLEKNAEQQIDRDVLSKVYKMYKSNLTRQERKDFSIIMKEIEETKEFENLTDEQKRNLAKSFLKEDEKEFEISQNRLDALNEIISRNIENKTETTDYDLLYNVAKQMAKGMKRPKKENGEIETKLSMEETKELALKFFGSSDPELFEKAQSIIKGESEIELNMYNINEVENFDEMDQDGMPKYKRNPCVVSNDKKTSIYIPCSGNIKDVYDLVHEISHTFDILSKGKDNGTRNLLVEITPGCFELMLSKFLSENNIGSSEDIKRVESRIAISHYDDAVETFAKLELMKIKNEKGQITQKDLIDIQKKNGLSNRNLGYILGGLANSRDNVDYKARYMLSQLVAPYFMEQYTRNPELAIENLKGYFEQIRRDDLFGSLQKLGITPDLHSIQLMIDANNARVNNTVINFSMLQENDSANNIINSGIVTSRSTVSNSINQGITRTQVRQADENTYQIMQAKEKEVVTKDEQ